MPKSTAYNKMYYTFVLAVWQTGKKACHSGKSFAYLEGERSEIEKIVELIPD